MKTSHLKKTKKTANNKSELVMPYRSSSKVQDGLKVGKEFVTRGVKRLVKLFRKRVRVEWMFGRAKE